jgi:TPR repeat protein
LLLFIQKEDGVALTKQEIKKARKNDGETLYNIGYDYYNNKKDKTKAFMWLHKAALENHDKAQNYVGHMYSGGLGVPQDYKLAMEWYQKAAFNGYSIAQLNIGYMYDGGLGVSQNYKLFFFFLYKQFIRVLKCIDWKGKLRLI